MWTTGRAGAGRTTRWQKSTAGGPARGVHSLYFIIYLHICPQKRTHAPNKRMLIPSKAFGSSQEASQQTEKNTHFYRWGEDIATSGSPGSNFHWCPLCLRCNGGGGGGGVEVGGWGGDRWQRDIYSTDNREHLNNETKKKCSEGKGVKNALVEINVVFWLTRRLGVSQQMSHGVRGLNTRLGCNDLVSSVRNLPSDSRPCHSSVII